MSLENVFYINLEHRIDRRKSVENQLNNLNWKFQRFPAIQHENGRIGCTLSHLQILKIAKQNSLPYVVIVEDDIIFTKPKTFKKSLSEFFNSNIQYDVIIIAGNVIPPYQKTNLFSIKVSFCQTTTGYMVKQHYYDKLIHNIKTGLDFLIQYPSNHVNFAIDKWWTKLQKTDNWYFIYPPTVVQADDYSDIEKKDVKYSNVMLDVNKEWLNKSLDYYPPTIFSSEDKEGVFYDARGSVDIYMQKKENNQVLKSLLNTPDKIKNFITKDKERKKELIDTYIYQLENNTTIYEMGYRIHDDDKTNLSETTFIIPFFYDFPERLVNLNTLINFISKHFNTNIFIIEWGPTSVRSFIQMKFKNTSIKYFYTQSDQIFSRTIVTNHVLKYVETQCVVINDVDCFTLPQSYQTAQDMILYNNFKILHPFSTPPGCINILPNVVEKIIKDDYNINEIDLKYSKINSVAGVGGILFIHYDTYKLLGFENIHFISYSPEDMERIKRFRRLNLKSTEQINETLHNSNDKYFKSPLFHMEHPRTDQSTIMHKYFQSNELLMHCIDNMSQDDFIQYIYENSNSELDINQYKKIISNISSLTNT